jgi:hypothetical protein
MDLDPNRYWPFDVVPPDRQTEQHRREIQLLETAYREGFRPYQFGTQNFGASAGERGGVILCRRSRWEVILGSGEETAYSALFGDFGQAAEAILLWLRGGIPGDVADRVPGRIGSIPAMMANRRE